MFIVSFINNELLIKDTEDSLIQMRINTIECSTVNICPSMYDAYKEIISLYDKYLLNLSSASNDNLTRDVVKCLRKHNISATDLIEYV